MPAVFKLFLLFLIIQAAICVTSPSVFILPAIVNPPVPALQSAYALAVEDINNSSAILPHTQLVLEKVIVKPAPEALAVAVNFAESGYSLIAGNEFSDVATVTGIVSTVYGIAQFSGMATSSVLSDKSVYPYFSRSISPSNGQIRAHIDTLLYYENIQGRGWTDIAIISSTTEYGIDMAENLIEKSDGILQIKTFQQFIVGADGYDVEFQEILKTGARVIFAFMYKTSWNDFVIAANSSGLIGDNYVWITGDDFVGATDFAADDNIAELTRGMLGSFEYIPPNDKLDAFLERWTQLDPEVYGGTGPGNSPSFFNLMGYDAMFIIANAIDMLDRLGEFDNNQRVSPERWTSALRNVTWDGVSGFIELDNIGNRISSYSLNYFDADTKSWQLAFTWSEAEGLDPVSDVIWFTNSTEIPDLDIREPFHYWSCDDKELKYDPTGKADLQTPDRSDVDDIDSDYHCDHFIDCENISDESYDCEQNFTLLFIIFGIITGILILLSVLLLLFVIIFGLILKYQKLRISSPTFLVLILLSMIVGYSSVFAWFGKPHPVACTFQPWLLGLSAISMITALCTKTFRIWRIFRRELIRQRIKDFELLKIWGLLMLPALLILTLWAIVSTPTARMKERNGEDHYVCTTGGFTGEPGGYVFFSVFVVYSGFVLLIGVFLSIVTRKVPSQFNESKLLAISIYNLGFLSVVIIPVFLVIQPLNPFVAWILRTIAILYAFTATLILQFFPVVIRVILFDRCSNVKIEDVIVSTSSTSRKSSSTSMQVSGNSY